MINSLVCTLGSMKHLSYLRYLLFVLVFATASACGDDDKQDDPKPQSTSHTVSVRMTGAGLTGLGARVSGGTNNTEGTDPQQVFFLTPAGATINQQETLPEKVPSTREFYTTVSFENVKGTSKAPSGSYFTAEVLVDGVVKKTVRIDNTTAAGAAYVTARVSIRTTEWH